MGVLKRGRGPVVLGIIGVGALFVLTACGSSVEVQPTASPTPGVSEPTPYAGPVVFVGDELEGFLLTPSEITGLLPEATDIGDVSSVLEQISDGGGMPATPAICDALYMEQSLGTVGARTIEWKVPTDPDYGSGELHILQFADEAQAQSRMDQLLQAAEQCGQFTKEAPATFDAVVPESAEDVSAFAGTLIDVDAGYDWRVFHAFASTGNVIVQVMQPFTGDRSFDAEAAALLLQSSAAEARADLIDALTENPPVAEEESSTDPGALWSDWKIDVGGVGPLRLGAEVEDALAAAGGAEVIDPTYSGGPWTLVDPEGDGTILVQPVEDGSAVWSVTVGDARSLDSVQDGAALPARGDIRIGAPVASAIAAFPGGTIVDVVSSGEDFYAVTTRDGQVFRFVADRDVVEDGATIVGITVEDATARRPAVFS